MTFLDMMSFIHSDLTPEQHLFISLERVIDCSLLDYTPSFLDNADFKYKNKNSETLKLWRKSYLSGVQNA